MHRSAQGFTVVSGGQTGVDQAGLRAARDRGLATGGWCPPGSTCESGKIPGHFGLTPTPRERADSAPDIPRSLRTEWNVRDSDGTLILLPADLDIDPGTGWTRQCTNRYDKPLLVCDPRSPSTADRVRAWLVRHRIRVLNVAGPSESRAPGIGAATYATLYAAFSTASNSGHDDPSGNG